MQVQKVEQNKSSLGNGIKSAAIGGAVGLAAQYALPLTHAEMDDNYNSIIKNIKENSVKTRNEVISSLKDSKLKQPSVDTYVKSAPKMTNAAIRQYHWQLKTARGAVPFVVTGAVTGFMTSFIRKTFKTDVA